MAIDEAKKLALRLGDEITELLRQYEADTGMSIHSVPLDRRNKQILARVKVQLS